MPTMTGTKLKAITSPLLGQSESSGRKVQASRPAVSQGRQRRSTPSPSSSPPAGDVQAGIDHRPQIPAPLPTQHAEAKVLRFDASTAQPFPDS